MNSTSPFPTADRVIAPAELIREVLSALGLVGPGGADWMPSAAALFDLFAHGTHPGPLRQFARAFDVIATPATAPHADPAAGDLLVRRGDGGHGHLAVVAGPGVVPHERLVEAGLRPEGFSTGGYVHVTEEGIRPRAAADGFARRLTGSDGRVLADTIVLRPRLPAAEAAAPPAGGRLLRRGSKGPDVREAQLKLNQVHANQLSAGRPGLDKAPLDPDGDFGTRTHAAVVSFQRLAFPGQPTEHDGVIGPKTRAALELFLTPPDVPPVPVPPVPPLPPLPPLPIPNGIVFNTDPRYWFLDDSAISQARGGGEGSGRTLSVFTSRNQVTPLADGQAMMAALFADIAATGPGDFVHFTAWRMTATQPMVPGPGGGATAVGAVWPAAIRRGATSRTLLWNAPASPVGGSGGSGANARENRATAALLVSAGGQAFLDGRLPPAPLTLPTLPPPFPPLPSLPSVGAHHQKTAIVQRNGEAVAYCGGIDLCPDRWDTPAHNSDPRRTREVMDGWHDVHCRIRGEAAKDIEANFRDRWNDPTPPAGPGTPVPTPIAAPLPLVASNPGTHHVQVLRTYACKGGMYPSFAPGGEFTILEGYRKAIGRARNYIYIEEQYLVSDELAGLLAAVLPRIQKLVILVPRDTDGPPPPAFNFHQDRFLRIVRAAGAGKVHIFHPVQPGTGRNLFGRPDPDKDLPIYVHAKVMIVDDVFAAIGTPNFNRRGISHDAEITTAVIDADVVDGVCRYARDLRRQLWGEHLALPTTDPAIADPITGVTEWERQATTGTARVRRHTVSRLQVELRAAWDAALDPDGRCPTIARPVRTAARARGTRESVPAPAASADAYQVAGNGAIHHTEVAARPAPNVDPAHWFLTNAEIEASRGGGDALPRMLKVYSSKNLVRPLIDGEEMMKALHDDVVATKRGDLIHFTGWRMDRGQELVPSASGTSTVANLWVSAIKRGVVSRTLLWRPAGGKAVPRFLAPNGKDNAAAVKTFRKAGGEAVLDARFPAFGSHHQKSAVVVRNGETVAYCGGIDLAPDRWDTRRHDDDPRRPDRELLFAWHDVHCRVRGPAALDIEQNFRDRWNDPTNPSSVPRVKPPPKITAPMPPVAAHPGTHHVQVLRTFACAAGQYPSFAPSGELTCLDGYVKAIDQAQRYIYIEDQYLVWDEIAHALARALDRIELLVIVVPEEPDAAAQSFNWHQENFVRILRAKAANAKKVHLFHLIQPSTGEQIYVHAKMMIIDDVYAVIGSTNMGRRSMTHDTELAVAVVDEELVDGGVCRYARDLRLNLWGEHLGLRPGDPKIADPVRGIKEWLAQAATGKNRVRLHLTQQPDEKRVRWDTVMDPDGRCAGGRGTPSGGILVAGATT